MKITSFSVYDQKKKVNDLKMKSTFLLYTTSFHWEDIKFPVNPLLCLKTSLSTKNRSILPNYLKPHCKWFNHIFNILRVVGIFIEQVWTSSHENKKLCVKNHQIWLDGCWEVYQNRFMRCLVIKLRSEFNRGFRIFWMFLHLQVQNIIYIHFDIKFFVNCNPGKCLACVVIVLKQKLMLCLTF